MTSRTMAAEGAGNVSETDSETSSLMGDVVVSSGFDIIASGTMKPPSPAFHEQLVKRVESLIQENRVLKMEVETYKARNRALQEENRTLKQASVLIQVKAEQEEEFISNTLLKQIQELKKEKEALALTYEQEEECLTNDLSRKLVQLKSEKAELSTTLKQEQEFMVNRLLKKIKKLEADTAAKQQHLEQLRREKVELENTLEQEQESLVNRLWKRMDKLENEKRYLQQKLETTHSTPPSPMDTSTAGADAPNQGQGAIDLTNLTDSNTSPMSPSIVVSIPPAADATTLSRHVQHLRNEISRLKQQLKHAQLENAERMQQMAREEQHIRDENVRLQRRLQLEVERREQLCRNLSESESSLEMEDERHFNELNSLGGSCNAALPPYRSRTISSPLASSLSTSGGDVTSVTSALGIYGQSAVQAGGVIVSNPGNSPTPPPKCATCGNTMPIALATSSPACAYAETRSQAHSAISGMKVVDPGEKIFLRPSKPATPKSSAASSHSSEGGSLK